MAFYQWQALFICFIQLAKVDTSTAPTDVADIQQMSAMAGGSITLTCRMEFTDAENMNAHMTLWRKLETVPLNFRVNGTDELPRTIRERVTIVNNRKHQGSFNLIINNLAVNDSGIYQCYVFRLPNLESSVISSVNLQVMVPPKDGYPKCRLISDSTTLSVGHLFSLKCTSKGGIPPSTVKWYLHGKAISRGGENSIIVPRVFSTRDYNATYTCKERSDALESERQCSITPHKSTFWVDISHKHIDSEYDRGKIKVKCRLRGSRNASPKFHWFMNGLKIGVATGQREYDVIEILNSESRKGTNVCCQATLHGEVILNCTDISELGREDQSTDESSDYYMDYSVDLVDYTTFFDGMKPHSDDIHTFTSIAPFLAAIFIGVSLGAALVLIITQWIRRKPVPLSIPSPSAKKRRHTTPVPLPSTKKSVRAQTIGAQSSFRPIIRPKPRPLSKSWTSDTRCLAVNSIFEDLSLLRHEVITSAPGANATSGSSGEGNVTDVTVVTTSSSDNPSSEETYFPLTSDSLASSRYEGLSSSTGTPNQCHYGSEGGLNPCYEAPDESFNYEDIKSPETNSWDSELEDVSPLEEEAEPFYDNTTNVLSLSDDWDPNLERIGYSMTNAIDST